MVNYMVDHFNLKYQAELEQVEKQAARAKANREKFLRKFFYRF